LNFPKKKIFKNYNKYLNIFSMINNRPLSPHLSIHKKVLTSVFSIFHRITGIGLSLGSILIAIWVSLIALGPTFFFIFEFLANSLIFKLILFLWTLAIFYHLFNGIRYLFWTYGLGMDLKTVYKSGYLILLLTLGATFFVWFI
jgi:succinate dehydrogenase / fumarate reductase cytochrome b subunit